MSDDYTQSITQPEIYWAEQAQRYIHWDQPWQSVLRGNMADGDVQWFVGAKLNACANCVDRHLPRHANKTAIIWEPDAPTDAPITLSYQQLYEADNACSLYTSQKTYKRRRRSFWIPICT